MEQFAEQMNNEDGVKPEEAIAMQIGSQFGWDCPGADPLNNIFNVAVKHD